jgi:predicted ATPase
MMILAVSPRHIPAHPHAYTHDLPTSYGKHNYLHNTQFTLNTAANAIQISSLMGIKLALGLVLVHTTDTAPLSLVRGFVTTKTTIYCLSLNTSIDIHNGCATRDYKNKENSARIQQEVH